VCTDIYLMVFQCREPQRNSFNFSRPSWFIQVSLSSDFSKHIALLVPFTLLCILSRPYGGLLWQFSITADMNELFVWSHNLFSKTSVLLLGSGSCFLDLVWEFFFSTSLLTFSSERTSFLSAAPQLLTTLFQKLCYNNYKSSHCHIPLSQAKCPELQVQAWVQTFYKAM